MRASVVLLAATFVVLIVACRSDTRQAPPAAEVADIIFVGRNIVTVDGNFDGAEGVAVRGEDIIAVGSRGEVLALQGDTTRLVELGDQALVPGFIDAHGHMTFTARLGAFINLSSPPVGPVKNIEDIVDTLRADIEGNEPAPGEWVIGYGYDDSLLAENRHPDRDDLDRVSTDHPIALLHVSVHLATVNSTALAAAAIDSATANPSGGVIRRRAGSDEPNGVLEETAAMPLVIGQILRSSAEETEALFRASAEMHASYGITTVQDGATTPEDVELLRMSAANEPYPIDVVAYPLGNRLDDEALAASVADREYSGGFRVGGVKFILDGSIQGKTAYLSEPYAEGPPGAAPDYRAYPSYPPTIFNERIALLLRAGVPALVHANGDAAIDTLIDGVAGALGEASSSDHRTVAIHAQTTREDQLHRMKELGIVPSFYAAHPFFWGDWHRQILGEERAAFISPLAGASELGIPYTIHNDAPIVPPDMLRLLWIAVNRKTRSGYVLGAEQRVTPLQALHAITQGAAYQYFEEDRKGSITPGKRADLVVLGANPLTVDPDTIKDIPIIETFARGESVYRR